LAMIFAHAPNGLNTLGVILYDYGQFSKAAPYP
jgi:hypothetical protein